MEMKRILMRAVLSLVCFGATFALRSFAAEEDSPFPRLPANIACTGSHPTGLKIESPVRIQIKNISTADLDLMLWTESTDDGNKAELEMTVERVIPYTGSGFKITGAVPDAWAPGRPSPNFQLVVMPQCPQCPALFLATDNKNYRYQMQFNCSY